MRLPTLRGHGWGPKVMKARLRRRLGRSDISHSKLRLFLDEMARRPSARLPGVAPTSISLVVPCYRHVAYLEDMLASIVAQTRLPDEVIFVDDRSPDETADVLRAFIAAHPWPAGGRLEGERIQLIVNDRNLGQAASLNRGIAAASSDLIMILNDDDYLMHDAVETMLRYFGEYRDVALIGCMNVGFGGRDALGAAAKLSTAYAAPDLPLLLRLPKDVAGYRHPDEVNMTHSGLSFFRVAWDAVGGYRSNKRERVVPFSDTDFQLRMNAVFPVAIADGTPLVFWRMDSSVDNGLNS